MNDRERFVRTVLGEPVDRPSIWINWGPWESTWKRWEAEGKPPEIKDHRSWMNPDMVPLPVPCNTGPCPRIPRTVLEEDDEYVTFIDTWGIKRRDVKGAESMSAFLEFPVKDRRDWEEFSEKYLNPDDERRLEPGWRETVFGWMDKGYPIQLGYYPDGGIFGGYRWLMGDEAGLIAFHTMPDLVHDIMERLTDIYLTTWERALREVRADSVHMWEDMCYRGGPLISPKKWVEFLGPCYRRIQAFTKQHDIHVISVDTDGDPDKIIPPMMDCGVNLLFPLEVAANCDVNVMRAKYPTLAFMGGIDKRVLALGPKAIDKELDRVWPAVEKGRYIPDLDHLVPDDVSWENYNYYVHELKRRVGKP